MANQATAGNTTHPTAGFSFVSGPFGPTPLLPPFTSMAPPPQGVMMIETGLLADTLASGGTGTPGGGPSNILMPDNARDNASAVGPYPGNHPLTYNGG